MYEDGDLSRFYEVWRAEVQGHATTATTKLKLRACHEAFKINQLSLRPYTP